MDCSLCLFARPFCTALWIAVLLLWSLDASNNTAMESYRAFIADKLPTAQHATGFLTQGFLTGLGITLANDVSLWAPTGPTFGTAPGAVATGGEGTAGCPDRRRVVVKPRTARHAYRGMMRARSRGHGQGNCTARELLTLATLTTIS